MPIISKVVILGSVFPTDEFRNYISLSNNQEYIQRTICHNHNIVDQTTGANTQAVESFDNKIKLFIKEKRGLMKA